MNVRNFHVEVTTVVNILKNFEVAMASGIDWISVKFLNDSAAVIAIHLANILKSVGNT